MPRAKSERVRGEGDADRNRIYAEAYNQDPDFFAFYRSMQAYGTALKPGETRLLLSPDSEFFQYFKNEKGKTGAPQTEGQPSERSGAGSPEPAPQPESEPDEQSSASGGGTSASGPSASGEPPAQVPQAQ